MPPRVKMRFSSRSLVSPSPFCRLWSHQLPLHVQRRAFADDRPIADRPFENKPSADGEAKGPNMDQLPHASEEAAAINKSMGGKGPEIEEQGTPVSEVVKGDKKAQENLPQIMKEEQANRGQNSNGTGSGTQGKRSFSTFARQQTRISLRSHSTQLTLHPTLARPFSHESLQGQQTEESSVALLQQFAAQASEEFNEVTKDEGLKFDPPITPPGPRSHLRKRYDTVEEQVTKLIMRHGKLSVAQRNMNTILTHLRTAPAPRPSDRARLIESAPPHQDLPLSPITYLTVAIDSVAPLFRIRSQKGLAGGGMALQIPIPLRQRQRRRTTTMWILEQVDKRASSTSPFAKRFAEEIVSIVEGRSSLWERRNALHANGMRARVNLSAATRRR